MKRFSLASLLLFAAVVALSVALLNTSFHLTKARAKLMKLRNDIRLLDPSQPDKPFVLLRYRKGLSPANGVCGSDPMPTDGLLVWIERASVAQQEPR